MPAHTLPDTFKPKFLEDYLKVHERHPKAFARGFLAYIDDKPQCPYERDTPEADAFIAGVKCARRNVVDAMIEPNEFLPASPSTSHR